MAELSDSSEDFSDVISEAHREECIAVLKESLASLLQEEVRDSERTDQSSKSQHGGRLIVAGRCCVAGSVQNAQVIAAIAWRMMHRRPQHHQAGSAMHKQMSLPGRRGTPSSRRSYARLWWRQ